MKINYISGQPIGECVFLEDDGRRNGNRYCKFRCHCGNEFITTMQKVKSLHTRSCGYLHSRELSERNTKHGFRYIPEYSIWLNMKQRCTNPKYYNYHIWGGRGITMCERWLNSFENFYEDVGNQPAKRMGIDRIDNELGYYKENCRWANQKIQNNNTRKNRMIEFNGKRQSLSLWRNELKLNYIVAAKRFRQGIKTVSEIFEMSKLKTA